MVESQQVVVSKCITMKNARVHNKKMSKKVLLFSTPLPLFGYLEGKGAKAPNDM